jgi:hypothetical protein
MKDYKQLARLEEEEWEIYYLNREPVATHQ